MGVCSKWGGLAQWLASRTTDQEVPRSYGPRVRDLAATQFVVALSKSHLLTAYYLLNPGSRGRTTRTNCDEAGDYIMPNVVSPRDQFSRHDNMD